MYDEPSTADVEAALSGGYCPFCGDDDPVRAPFGGRARCRGCRARWVVHAGGVTQVPHPPLGECGAQATPVRPSTSECEAQVRPAHPSISEIDRVAGEVERFRAVS